MRFSALQCNQRCTNLSPPRVLPQARLPRSIAVECSRRSVAPVAAAQLRTPEADAQNGALYQPIAAADGSSERMDEGWSIDEGQSSAEIDLQLPRRRLLVAFTCNKCDGRSERLVNPDAYYKGLVFVQCQHCEVWHQIADNQNLIEEYDLTQMGVGPDATGN